MSATADRLELIFHPAKQHSKKAAALAFGLGIIGQIVWQLLEPPFALLTLTLLLASLRDFFLETRYTLNESGISIYGLLKPLKTYPWARFRSFVEDRNGLFLSPYRAKQALDLKRGLFLALEKDQRNQTTEFCRKMKLERRAA